jgi:hypothetical protein
MPPTPSWSFGLYRLDNGDRGVLNASKRDEHTYLRLAGDGRFSAEMSIDIIDIDEIMVSTGVLNLCRHLAGAVPTLRENNLSQPCPSSF